MRNHYIGAAKGEHCDPLEGINCESDSWCNSSGVCYPKKGTVCGGDAYCNAVTEAITNIDPIITPTILSLANFIADLPNLIPASFWASSEFYAVNAEGQMFQKIMVYWHSLVGYHGNKYKITKDGSLDIMWETALSSVGLPTDTPFSLPKSFLKPAPNLLRQDLPKDYWTGICNSPEEAIYTYCYGLAGEAGWASYRKHQYNSDDTQGYACVQNTIVAEGLGPGFKPNADRLTDFDSPLNYWPSYGPMGINDDCGGGWPKRCNESCMRQFYEAVTDLWRQRLNVLNSSLPIISNAVARRVADMSVVVTDDSNGKWVKSGNNEIEISRDANLEPPNGNKEKSGHGLLYAVLGIGAMAGIFYAISYYGGKETSRLERYGSKRKSGFLKASDYKPRWSEYIRGEWWILKNGEAVDANTESGEGAGHVEVAAQYMIDRDALMEIVHPGEVSAVSSEYADRYSDGHDLEYTLDKYNKLVSKSKKNIISVIGSVQKWKDWVKEPRVAFMKHENAIQVVNLSFACWILTQEKIKMIQEFILEQVGYTDIELGDFSGNLSIEQLSPYNYKSIPINWFLELDADTVNPNIVFM